METGGGVKRVLSQGSLCLGAAGVPKTGKTAPRSTEHYICYLYQDPSLFIMSEKGFFCTCYPFFYDTNPLKAPH